MTSRRLEVRIKKLCEQALKAEHSELESVFQELRAVLHEHNQLIERLASEGVRHPPRSADSSALLHRMASESRLRAVESQLALAVTLCAIAETELQCSRPDQAIKVINKVRHHTRTITLHIDEPNHLPSTAISGLRKQVAQLVKRTEAIQSRLI
jgi:hypothetical protein